MNTVEKLVYDKDLLYFKVRCISHFGDIKKNSIFYADRENRNWIRVRDKNGWRLVRDKYFEVI